MTSPQTYDIYKTIDENNVIIIYDGEFNQDITKMVLSMAEKELSYSGVDFVLKKRIYNIMVELLQNICKHQYSDNGAIQPAIFLVGADTTGYFIMTGNLIDNTNIDTLRSKLDNINSLDKDALKKLYKEARLKSVISEVGGAGLGFIDIIRKSGNGVLYNLNEVDSDASFFSMLINISNINTLE